MMKTLLTLLTAAGLMVGSAHAIVLPQLGVDCGEIIAIAPHPKAFDDYKKSPGGKYAGWAVANILAADLSAPDASTFRHVDTSNQVVMIGAGDRFIMTHFGGGGKVKIPDSYQLIDVSDCTPGEHWLPSPRPSGGGLSWVGRIGGGGTTTVPDGGTTVIMMGLALCGLASTRKLLKH